MKLLIYAALRVHTGGRGDSFAHSDETYDWPDWQFGPHGPRGDDLLDFARSRLPELRPGLEEINFRKVGHMSEAEGVSLVQNIQQDCACLAYTRQQTNVGSFTGLLGVARAIMRFVGLLSIARISDLLPTPSGLRQLYENTKPLHEWSSWRIWQHRWPSSLSEEMRETFQLFSTAETLSRGCQGSMLLLWLSLQH
jgi:hypothetical protein